MDKGYIFFILVSHPPQIWYVVDMHKMFLDLGKFVQNIKEDTWFFNFIVADMGGIPRRSEVYF